MTAVRGVFRQILSAARQKVKTQRVAYLGPQFSFTHLAAIERFGESADLIPVSTIASVFEEVNRGHADFGLVPIENSTDGRIVDTLDMFTRLPLRICGEVQIAVHHNLASKSPRSEITEIYSKPQALSQCREWLSRNMPHARLIEVTSTSTAAQLARDKPGVGAVASRQAAVEYELQIVAENIEDNANNVTRFAVIGDQTTRPTGHDRTAVLLQIPHKPGSLSDALQAFKKNKLNLTWIESFPLRGPESGYLFFIDFEGHFDEGRDEARARGAGPQRRPPRGPRIVSAQRAAGMTAPSRRKLVAGNWKMNTTRASAVELARAVAARVPAERRDVEVLVCPPFPYLLPVGRGHPRERGEARRTRRLFRAAGSLYGRSRRADARRRWLPLCDRRTQRAAARSGRGRRRDRPQGRRGDRRRARRDPVRRRIAVGARGQPDRGRSRFAVGRGACRLDEVVPRST